MSQTIVDVRVHSISIPLERHFWMSLEPYTTASEVVVEIETDDGIVGIGQAHGRPQEDIVHIIQEQLTPLLLGEDPLPHEHLWQSMFSLASTRQGSGVASRSGQPHFGDGATPQLMAAIAAIDIALWDIKGKVFGMPLYRLLGGHDRSVRTYASGGYYGPSGEPYIDELVGEMTQYAALGFDAVKLKVGGLDVRDDVRRVRAVREALPSIGIMLDANCAWDVPTAVRAAQAFAEFDITWLEEPTAWYDPVEGLGTVARISTIPIASGERALHRWACRDLVQRAGILVLQFDCTRAGGVTEWLRVAAQASSYGILMAPHHDPQVHGHLLAAVPNAYVQEVFCDPARDPLWDQLFEQRPQVVDGELILSDQPGLGIALDFDTVAKYGAPVARSMQ